MGPKETIYRLSQPQDIRACKKIWAEKEKDFGKPKKLGWPTIVAERNGKILGFLTTGVHTKFIVAGPLILNGGSSGFTTLRLVEAYEVVLRMAKVDGFFFSIDKTQEKWANIAREIIPTAEKKSDKTHFWFYRKLS
jgi:hypothetical protein